MLLIHKIQAIATHCMKVGVFIYDKHCFILFPYFLVDTIPGGFYAFIAYRRPIANQFVTLQQSTISYFYIAATNSDTEVRGSVAITPTSQDQNLLQIRFINAFVSTSGLNVILNRDSINVDVSTTVGYTVVGMYSWY